MVKAGLLPRLDPKVIPVYVEASPLDTETRILRNLRKKCPMLDKQSRLKESIAQLRRGIGIPQDQKVVLIIDQFEQWLHSGKINEDTPLVQALRQCDGGQVQCLLLVRDDFWMAATRFMHEIEVPLIEAHNSAAVDLFPVRHAKKVLAAFGRSFGTLPEDPAAITKDQKAFLEEATEGLATDSLVICVRLALFAEMMKNRSWSRETLTAVGGAKGVGSAFLADTFEASSAPPHHRYHQAAAREVLAALLPSVGTQIKGQMRSRKDLLEISGYQNRQRDFDELIKILDRDTRLITPTDTDGSRDQESSSPGQYYQLTHDYLVPSLRNWLTQKQMESSQGRANLLLADRSDVWNRTGLDRHLPSFPEWARIVALTEKSKWNKAQKAMMNRSRFVHAFRGVLLLLLVVASWLVVSWLSNRNLQQGRIAQTDGLIQSISNSLPDQLPGLIDQLRPLRDIADDKLVERRRESTSSTEKLNLSLALLPTDPKQAEFLTEQLPKMNVGQFETVSEALNIDTKGIEHLWATASDESHPISERFQAFVALADHASDDPRWNDSAPFIVNYVTDTIPTSSFSRWTNLLSGRSKELIQPLRGILADTKKSNRQRSRAADVLSQYQADQVNELVESLLLTSEYDQYSPLVEALRPYEAQAKSELLAAFESSPLEDLTEEDIVSRRALAATALVEFGGTEIIWPMLRLQDSPSLRSVLISHLRQFRADSEIILRQLADEKDVSIQRALVQVLGGAHQPSVSNVTRVKLVDHLKTICKSEVDPGLHASATWALNNWKTEIPDLPVGLEEVPITRIQEVAYWDSELSKLKKELEQAQLEISDGQADWEQQILKQATARSVPDPISRFGFDSVGLELTDEVNGEIGTYIGEDNLELVGGLFQNALRLDGTGGIECGTSFSPDREQSFSYGCWVKFTKEWGAVMSKMDTDFANRGFDMWLEGGCLSAHIVRAEPDNFIKVTADFPMTMGKWHHAFVTYDGSSRANGIKLYVDGVSVRFTAKELSSTIRDSIVNDKPFLIGQRPQNSDGVKSYPYIGLIDDVRIYDSELSDTEVKTLYNEAIAECINKDPDLRSDQKNEFLVDLSQQSVINQIKEKIEFARKSRFEARWKEIPRWYVNKEQQTMMILADPTMTADNPFDYTFAIGAHEVTLEEFARFREQNSLDSFIGPDPGCPIHMVSWWDAAAYCNWLSEQNDIPPEQWCYQPNGEGFREQGMEAKSDHLQLSGYRLPTESEWLFACRAGTNTKFSSGNSTKVVNGYAWSANNSIGRSYAVGTLLPNDFGLFDMHGNVWEWCDDEVTLKGTNVQGRLLKGGGFTIPAHRVSYEASTGASKSFVDTQYGFRVARTIEPSSSETVDP